jgi:hypothetical protein
MVVIMIKLLVYSVDTKHVNQSFLEMEINQMTIVLLSFNSLWIKRNDP